MSTSLKNKKSVESVAYAAGEVAGHAAAKSASAKSNEGNTAMWAASIETMMELMLKTQGAERGGQFLTDLAVSLRRKGAQLPPLTRTPYVNTIPVEEQPAYPGD